MRTQQQSKEVLQIRDKQRLAALNKTISSPRFRNFRKQGFKLEIKIYLGPRFPLLSKTKLQAGNKNMFGTKVPTVQQNQASGWK